MSIPDELARREDRLETIGKAKEEIQRRASGRYAREKEAYDKKMAEREAKEQESGKKPGGREAKPAEPISSKKEHRAWTPHPDVRCS